jgi:Holliday junction resolvase RusA-like endonuclease
MAEYTLIIPGVLPGLNEYINAERRNRYQAATMKKQAEHTVMVRAKQQLKSVKINKPVKMQYVWVEANRKRDKDNISFARKFIQDALVKVGILENDGWAQIEGFEDIFMVDKDNPRIMISIMEVEDELSV